MRQSFLMRYQYVLRLQLHCLVRIHAHGRCHEEDLLCIMKLLCSKGHVRLFENILDVIRVD